MILVTSSLLTTIIFFTVIRDQLLDTLCSEQKKLLTFNERFSVYKDIALVWLKVCAFIFLIGLAIYYLHLHFVPFA